VKALLRLYPPAWRARYGLEFEDLIAERPPTARDVLDILVSAIDARIAPQVGAEPSIRQAHRSDRLAGAAAISGGLMWFGAFVLGAVTQPGNGPGLLGLLALGLMLVSLPGRYLRPHSHAVALGFGAVLVSMVVIQQELLPWGPTLLVPVVIVLGAIGPGALFLAATRARFSTRNRWRLLLLTVPWPVIIGAAAGSGLLPEAVASPLLIIGLLPLGLAWIVTGVRLTTGAIVHTVVTSGGAS